MIYNFRIVIYAYPKYFNFIHNAHSTCAWSVSDSTATAYYYLIHIIILLYIKYLYVVINIFSLFIIVLLRDFEIRLFKALGNLQTMLALNIPPGLIAL